MPRLKTAVMQTKNILQGCLSKMLAVHPHNTEKDFADIKAIYNYTEVKISVRRTSNYTTERGTYTNTTKTKRLQITLKILPYIMNILRQLKNEQDFERIFFQEFLQMRITSICRL